MKDISHIVEHIVMETMLAIADRYGFVLTRRFRRMRNAKLLLYFSAARGVRVVLSLNAQVRIE